MYPGQDINPEGRIFCFDPGGFIQHECTNKNGRFVSFEAGWQTAKTGGVGPESATYLKRVQ